MDKNNQSQDDLLGLDGQKFVGGRSGRVWQLIEKIGSGSFGLLFLGRENVTNQNVAVKVAPSFMRTLANEVNVYTAISGMSGIPKVHYVEIGESSQHVIVMDLLGPSLEELFHFCDKKFTLVTVLLLAEQMLHRLQSLHQRGFVHRDVKPGNFLMGVGQNRRKVYLIDFGLSKRYYNHRRQCHVPLKKDCRILGTSRFISLNVHHGQSTSRRDDLESFCYCLLYFIKSQLPWQGIKAQSKRQKLEKIYECKKRISVETLCNGLPPEFALILNYCRGLIFDETPNYDFIYLKLSYLLDTMREIGNASLPNVAATSTMQQQHQLDDKFSFDWEILRERIIAQTFV